MKHKNYLKVFLIEHWYSRGKNNSDLARILEVDPSLVSKWLSGVAEPTFEKKIAIARALLVDSRIIFPERLACQ